MQPDEEDLVIVTCDEGVAGPLVEMFAEHAITSESSGRRNLDGAAVTSWLVVAGIAVKALPEVLRALSEFLTRERVRRIEFQGLVLDNPRPEDVNEIIKRLPLPPST